MTSLAIWAHQQKSDVVFEDAHPHQYGRDGVFSRRPTPQVLNELGG